MHLVGQLSRLSSSLEVVFDVMEGGMGFPEPPPSPQPIAEEPRPRRLGNGVVQRAVVKVLAAAKEPMRGADIHLAVERLLGHPISKNSVSWCLASGARAEGPRFERVAYGCYRLVPQT